MIQLFKMLITPKVCQLITNVHVGWECKYLRNFRKSAISDNKQTPAVVESAELENLAYLNCVNFQVPAYGWYLSHPCDTLQLRPCMLLVADRTTTNSLKEP